MSFELDHFNCACRGNIGLLSDILLCAHLHVLSSGLASDAVRFLLAQPFAYPMIALSHLSSNVEHYDSDQRQLAVVFDNTDPVSHVLFLVGVCVTRSPPPISRPRCTNKLLP
jgi:hypothetical protein